MSAGREIAIPKAQNFGDFQGMFMGWDGNAPWCSVPQASLVPQGSALFWDSFLPPQQIPEQGLSEVQDVPEAPQGLQLSAEGGTHLGPKATAGEENFWSFEERT